MGGEKARLVLFGAVMAVLAACEKTPTTFAYTLPNGFTGPIVVVFDPKAAPPPPAGTVHVDVPGDGVVISHWGFGTMRGEFYFRASANEPLPQVPLKWTAGYSREWDHLRGRAAVYAHTQGGLGNENRPFVSYIVGDISQPAADRQNKLISDVAARLPQLLTR